mgnify:CR=1 FL=1
MYETKENNVKRGIFIAGTDTAVGKTLVTAALAASVRELALDVGVMKPTYHPAAAKARQTARPMPPEAPVTRTERRSVFLVTVFLAGEILMKAMATRIMSSAQWQRKPGSTT